MISFNGLIPVFGVAYAVLRRVRSRLLRPLPLKLYLPALLPMAVDGGTHAINDLLFGVSGGGFRDANTWLATLTGNAFPGFYVGDHFGTFNWWMRLITGTLAAWAVVFLALPYVDLPRRPVSPPGRQVRQVNSCEQNSVVMLRVGGQLRHQQSYKLSPARTDRNRDRG